MATDAKSILDQATMRAWQWAAVIVTVGLNALDGFDVLSISFAAPGIAKDWGVDKATLGWVLSTELLGMALGSMMLGGAADRRQLHCLLDDALTSLLRMRVETSTPYPPSAADFTSGMG